MASNARSFMSGGSPASSKSSGKNSGILSGHGSQKMDGGKKGDEKALMRYAIQTGGVKHSGATCVAGGSGRASKTVSKDRAGRGG